MAERSFWDSESRCSIEFSQLLSECSSIWHYCTPGHLNVSVNLSPQDFSFSVNNYALSAFESGVSILTDAHMSNHTHGLLCGTLEQVKNFEEAYLYRENKYLNSCGRDVDLHMFCCDNPIPITSIDMMRNEIVYINRNGAVVDRMQTPFSYQWSGGYVYFNHAAQNLGGIPFNSLKYREKRAISFKSSVEVPGSYKFCNGMITQASYMRYDIGQRMFRDAHQYFSMLSRNAEAYSEIAKRLGDQIFLTDDEMYSTIATLSKKDYQISQPHMLPYDAKLSLARKMHESYNATNSQIQRILKLPAGIVSELYPLRVKR